MQPNYDKQPIAVRKYYADGVYSTTRTIHRVLNVDQVGNFNRVICRHASKCFLVHSDAGNIGDPFRADKTYLQSLWIDIDKPLTWII